MAQALEGILVLDLSRTLPGPYCTMFMADFGAQVINIEETETGDPFRVWPPLYKGVGANHLMVNRNKRSLALNLKDERGREIFYKLAAKADVILEGFRPGVVKRLGVDYETTSKINPRVIYCSLSGYGQDGPYTQLVGHDLNYLAIGGILGVTGEPDRPPAQPGTQIADLGGGLMALVAILLALQARTNTGRGQYLDVAMLDQVVSWLSLAAAWYIANGRSPERGGMRGNGGDPGYHVYETRDGKYITIGVLEPHFWANLCRELGREDLIAHQVPTGEKREEILSTFREIFRTKTRDEWFEQFKGKDICVGPVNSLEETFADPHVRHRKMAEEVEHPAVGPLFQLGIPVKMSDTPGAIRTPPPLLGQHTQEILLQLGYTEAQVRELRQEKVVR